MLIFLGLCRDVDMLFLLAIEEQTYQKLNLFFDSSWCGVVVSLKVREDHIR